MTAKLIFTNEGKKKTEDLCTAAFNSVSVDLTTLTTKIIMIDSPSASIIDDYKFPPPFVKEIVHTMSRLDVSATGEMHFMLTFVDAITIGGLMLMLKDEKIHLKRQQLEFTDTDVDAYKEACNIISGAFAKGMKDFIGKDFSLAQKETSLVSFMKTSPTKLFPDSPYVAVQMRMSIGGFQDSHLMQLIPASLLETLMGLISQPSPFITEKGRVLMINADIHSSEEMSKMFAGTGFTFNHVPGYVEAFAFMESHPVSLIIIDLNAVKAAHINLFKKFKTHQSYSGVPLLGMCAKNTAVKESVVEALQSGASDFILRPIDRESLLAKAQKWSK